MSRTFRTFTVRTREVAPKAARAAKPLVRLAQEARAAGRASRPTSSTRTRQRAQPGLPVPVQGAQQGFRGDRRPQDRRDRRLSGESIPGSPVTLAAGSAPTARASASAAYNCALARTVHVSRSSFCMSPPRFPRWRSPSLPDRRCHAATAPPPAPPAVAAAAWLLVDVTSGQTLTRGERRRAPRPGVADQAHDGVPRVRRAAREDDHAVADGRRVRARMARRRLADVHRAAPRGLGRRAAARHDRAIGQRRVDRAGRARRRQRGGVRRADERRSGAARHGQHPLHQRDRPVRARSTTRRRPTWRSSRPR